jgi:divalent metal cation (Fe/Co/Zn/Cd) transporter
LIQPNHSHDTSNRSTKIIALAGVSFLVLALLELVAGLKVSNPAVRANSAHDALDGMTFLAGGTIIAACRRSLRHGWFCLGPKVVSLIVILFAITSTALGSLIDHHASSSAASASVGVGLGSAAFILNRFWHKRLVDTDSQHEHAGLRFDLVADMVTSALVVVSSSLSWTLSSPQLTSLAAWLIVLIVLILGFTQMVMIFRTFHHEKRHVH